MLHGGILPALTLSAMCVFHQRVAWPCGCDAHTASRPPLAIDAQNRSSCQGHANILRRAQVRANASSTALPATKSCAQRMTLPEGLTMWSATICCTLKCCYAVSHVARSSTQLQARSTCVCRMPACSKYARAYAYSCVSTRTCVGVGMRRGLARTYPLRILTRFTRDLRQTART